MNKLKLLILTLPILAIACTPPAPEPLKDKIKGAWIGDTMIVSDYDVRQDLLIEARRIFKTTVYQFNDSAFHVSSEYDPAGTGGEWNYIDSLNTLIMSPENQMAILMQVNDVSDSTMVLEQRKNNEHWVQLFLKRKHETNDHQ